MSVAAPQRCCRDGSRGLTLGWDMVVDHIVNTEDCQIIQRREFPRPLTDLKLVLNSGRSAWSDLYKLRKVAITAGLWPP